MARGTWRSSGPATRRSVPRRAAWRCTAASIAAAPRSPGLAVGQVVICDALACPATHANQATGLGVVNLASVTIEGYVFDSLLDIALPGSGAALVDRRFPAIGATMRAPL